MPHVIVVGAGIVGLCSAWSAQRRGWQVTLVDRDFEGDRASHGNAGAVAVCECIPLNLSGLGLAPLKWLADPLGPLSIRLRHAPRLLPWFLALRRVAQGDNFHRLARALAALNDHCLGDFEAMLADIGLADHLHKAGALSVYETQAGFDADQAEWQLKRRLGVRWREVGVADLRLMEPGLAPVFVRAVMQDDWAHVNDPKAIVTRLREQVAARGAKLVRGEALAMGQDGSVRLQDGQTLQADKLVLACGAWSATLASSIGDKVLLESERGYNTTLPAMVGRLNREIIFAERKFVATPLAIGLRIGGAAEFAGLSAPANYQRSAALLQLAKRFIQNVDETGAQQWMGNRPATPDSLPVIGRSPRTPKVLYAFGHGHLGLTQSATTGELIGELLTGSAPKLDLAAYSVGRF